MGVDTTLTKSPKYGSANADSNGAARSTVTLVLRGLKNIPVNNHLSISKKEVGTQTNVAGKNLRFLGDYVMEKYRGFI